MSMREHEQKGARTQWDKTRAEHIDTRTHLAAEIGVVIPPPVITKGSAACNMFALYRDHVFVAPPLHREPLQNLIRSPWFRILSERQRDRLLMESAVLQSQGKELSGMKLLWDLSNGLDYPCRKDKSFEGYMSCLCTEHDIWLGWRQRLMTGLEQMMIQGLFQRSC